MIRLGVSLRDILGKKPVLREHTLYLPKFTEALLPLRPQNVSSTGAPFKKVG